MILTKFIVHLIHDPQSVFSIYPTCCVYRVLMARQTYQKSFVTHRHIRRSVTITRRRVTITRRPVTRRRVYYSTRRRCIILVWRCRMARQTYQKSFVTHHHIRRRVTITRRRVAGDVYN